MPDDRDRHHPDDQALNRFWNELVRPTGDPDAAAAGLDPDLAETVRRLRALAKTPPPVSARERARRGLTEQFDTHRAGKETSMLQSATLTLPVEPGPDARPNRPARVMPAVGRHRQDWRRAMKSRKVTGGGGAQLHVVEAGNPRGRPIVFIHGFSQCGLAWSRQLRSDLADDYRLVALDLRGHGLSDKPRDGYADSKLWADDVHAAIRDLRLDHPVLCGWSYGPLVILDYLRHYGEDGIGGIHFVDAITKLGSEAALSVLTPEFLGLVPGFFATDAEQSVRSLEALLRLCFAREPAAEELYLMLGYNVVVPPHVRQALLSRSFDNDDLLPTIRTPALLTHGAEDAVVTPAVVDQHKAGMGHAQVRVMANAGHAPFWDDAATFNQHVRAFCESL